MNELITHVEELELEIEELELEQRGIADSLVTAIRGGDDERLAELRRRRDALPAEILKARIAYQRASLELATAREDADKARLAEISREAGPVLAKIEELQRSVSPLLKEGNLIGSRQGQHRSRKQAAKKKLEMLLAERADLLTRETAPPIRSLWQGVRN